MLQLLLVAHASALVLRSAPPSARLQRTTSPLAEEAPWASMRLGQCLQYLTDRSAASSTDERIAALKANGCPQRVIDSVMKNTDLEGHCANGAAQDVIDRIMKNTALEQQAAAYDP